MKILLAVDGSTYSVPAVKVLLARPWPEGTTVRVLTAVPIEFPPELGVPGGVGMAPSTFALYSDAQQERTDEANAMVSALATQLERAGIDAAGVARTGDPAGVILDEARDWGADLILVGSHGRTGLRKLFMGSVAQKVVARATCSVEVARYPESPQEVGESL